MSRDGSAVSGRWQTGYRTRVFGAGCFQSFGSVEEEGGLGFGRSRETGAVKRPWLGRKGDLPRRRQRLEEFLGHGWVSTCRSSGPLRCDAMPCRAEIGVENRSKITFFFANMPFSIARSGLDGRRKLL